MLKLIYFIFNISLCRAHNFSNITYTSLYQKCLLRFLTENLLMAISCKNLNFRKQNGVISLNTKNENMNSTFTLGLVPFQLTERKWRVRHDHSADFYWQNDCMSLFQITTYSSLCWFVKDCYNGARTLMKLEFYWHYNQKY